ncbi:band 4.1-like protein 2 isoform 2 [Mus musculus]|uniref:Epb4.1l2 protein n=1 Tax=Mus musculus TaxID=10090 RepID=Q80UE5_MOUSE|nr:band 4.1-like protein 2 isoform 2 [Mus musculus]NP_001391732.1 band 4.1-like protein 2 isoform 2 [Mus musculus]NP_001391734.1 band 4.1-like protein 2 isoform 2 [Mus musculus]NP_001391735.1 band 4.1-like protein 2 isoform 2 [Mus musculus]NP_001391736.1 band 4.1-like protein 2 isoform 2 [Mus musculus]NP_001391737.1 band 4.1-like protein 2 isoform 2 [Mus musculus]NP_001391738.1 band 4.1-like protein 2 isoform 2 [Mus musculus]AJM71469.1 erythrocyte protein band 4.1l2 long variant [Mus musculu|eukprot:XP_006512579.1 PREDICTED: band 4.1-like protein 2 isoform X8 [Mus musculus]
MTTEVGSASEVKKGSDQAGADASKEKAKEVENEQTPVSEPEEEKGSQPGPPVERQSTPRLRKRGKDPSENRGISRFIPPWLKKQRSYNLVVAKDGGDKKEPTQADVEDQILGKEESLPEEESRAKGDAEEMAQRKHLEVQVEVREAKPALKSSVETQPAEEVRKDKEETIQDTQEEKLEGGAAKRETKEVQTSELKAEVASQKATKKTKTVLAKVTLLDGTEYSCDLEKRAKGQVLFDRVCEHLNLLEKDYFGLLFQDHPEQKNWLDPAKEIKRQLKNLPWLFTFNVKFYPPDPSQLTEDITRYFLCLQLRQDIASGRLPCSFVTHALLGSYTLQAEHGDYDPEEYDSIDLGDFQFAPAHTKELEEKVSELHKTHRGLSPAQADSQFLENAKRLSMYGVDLHHAKDSEGVDIKLGVCANGLLIYKDRLRINRFAWPKILKISYKRSNFYIKVRPAELEQFESTIGFKLPNHRAAKRLWKVCVEHHTFYRLVSPEQPPKTKFLTLGSKFRYSGRTQAQTREASTLIDRPAPQFERASSKRVSRSLDGAPIGVVDQSPPGEGSVPGPGVISYTTIQDGRRDSKSPTKATPLPAEGKSSHETLNVVEEKKRAEVGKDESVITEEMNGKEMSPGHGPGETRKVEPVAHKDSTSLSSESSSSSSESEEDVGEYQPHHRVTEGTIREEQEECDEELEEEPGQGAKVVEREAAVPDAVPDRQAGASVLPVETEAQEHVVAQKLPGEKGAHGGTAEQDPREEAEEDPHRVNGEVPHLDLDGLPEIICCSEPPVVKTEMVTISDASQRTEISTKEVPIVQTETKTITYESPQIDGGAGGDSGVLLTAQTITSESASTTTTTHITKTVKGGISETRIEKRIVITGDAALDHDQALAQAIREAREQHPDMSVTRVVVHKETELAEEGEE